MILQLGLLRRITAVILGLIRALRAWLRRRAAHTRPYSADSFFYKEDFLVNHSILADRRASLWGGGASFKFLPYQLSIVRYWRTMALTGNGESGFDSGEGAWETATTSKEGSRRVNYPIPTRWGSDKKYPCGAQVVLQWEWVQSKTLNKDQLEGKSGASSRGNSSSNSVY